MLIAIVDFRESFSNLDLITFSALIFIETLNVYTMISVPKIIMLVATVFSLA